MQRIVRVIGTVVGGIIGILTLIAILTHVAPGKIGSIAGISITNSPTLHQQFYKLALYILLLGISFGTQINWFTNLGASIDVVLQLCFAKTPIKNRIASFKRVGHLIGLLTGIVFSILILCQTELFNFSKWLGLPLQL